MFQSDKGNEFYNIFNNAIWKKLNSTYFLAKFVLYRVNGHN